MKSPVVYQNEPEMLDCATGHKDALGQRRWPLGLRFPNWKEELLAGRTTWKDGHKNVLEIVKLLELGCIPSVFPRVTVGFRAYLKGLQSLLSLSGRQKRILPGASQHQHQTLEASTPGVEGPGTHCWAASQGSSTRSSRQKWGEGLMPWSVEHFEIQV